MNGNTIIRLPDVLKLTGLSRSTVYSLVSQSRFPKPIRISDRCVGWIAEEVEDYLTDRILLSRQDELTGDCE
ncbi:MAG: AlpA family transcriptional regulator [Pseudomonadota bacterium]